MVPQDQERKVEKVVHQEEEMVPQDQEREKEKMEKVVPHVEY